MPATSATEERITVNRAQFGGEPCIRGMRIPAWMVLGLIATGFSDEEILGDFPDLEVADLDAVRALTAETAKASGSRRITIHPEHLGGEPCIRAMSIPAKLVFQMRLDGATDAQICDVLQDLESADIAAAWMYFGNSRPTN